MAKNYIADKETLDSVKTTTDTIKEDTESIKTLLYEGGGSEAADVASVLSIVKEIKESVTETYSVTYSVGNESTVHVLISDITNGTQTEKNLSNGETLSVNIIAGHDYSAKATCNNMTWLNKTYTAVSGNRRTDEVKTVSSSFATATMEEIDIVVENGLCSALWNVGDKRTMNIGGVDYQFAIMDFDKDEYYDGSGIAPITFGLVNSLKTTYQMNSSNTNVGGYASSAGKTTLDGDIYNSLPTEITNRIKAVKKKTSAGNKSTTINTTSEKLFLFSESEIFGTKTYSTGDEGEQYEYFKTSANRIKKLGDDGSANYWWGRSPYASYTTGFCFVGSSGNANSGNAPNSYGFSFGFCF